MTESLKKVALSTLAFVMMLTLSFGSFVPKAEALDMGDLVKGPNSDAVYYVGDGTKHVFPDSKTYFTWYSNFDAIQEVTVSELDSVPTGSPVPYRAGTKLITHPNTANVYAVEPDGTLRRLPDEATAMALYGANWSAWVQDVHELTFGNYSVGADLTSSMHAEGTLLQATGDTTIYYFDGTNIRPFADSTAFDANNLNFDNVVEVADLSGYSMGSSITGAEDFATIAGAGGTSGSAPLPAGTLNVSLSPNTPAAGLVAGSAARVPFTTIRMSTGSNPVTVDEVVVERAGIGQDGAFSSLDLLYGSTMLPIDQNSKNLNTNHLATFTKDFTIPANTTWDIIVAGNMISSLANNAGEVPALSVKSITLKGGSTMNGTLPIVGNPQTLNGTITIGTATVQRGSYSNATSTNLEVGKTAYTFNSFQVQAGSAEDVHFSQVSLYQNGTAQLESDLENFKLYRDGTWLADGVIDGKYVHFNFPDLEIPKGQTFQFKVEADVIDGSGRTVILGIYRATDLLVMGETYGFNITPTYSGTGSSANKPVLTDNSFTIGNGTLVVERSSTVGAGNITIGNSQTLGAFKFTVKGEPIDITALTLTIVSSTSNTAADPLTGVRLVDPSGTTVAGPTDPTNNALTVAFTDTFTAPVGETVYKVLANLNSTGQWATNDTIYTRIATPASAITAEGQITGNSITPTPSSNTDTNTQTIKTANLQVTKNTLPANGNVVIGKQDLVLGSWSFDANDSGEDVRVTSLLFAASSTNMSNLTVKVDGVAQSPVNDEPTTDGDGQTSTFALDTPIVITKGTSKTVTLEGDVNSGASAGEVVQFGLTDATAASNPSVVAYGVSTGNRATLTLTPDDGALLTFSAAGTVTVTTSGNPSPAIVRAGATGVTFGYIRFDAVDEDLDLDELTLFIADGGLTGTATGDYQDHTMAYLYDGATLVASNAIPSTGKYNWTFPNGTLTVLKDSQKTLTVKADVATISSSTDNSPGTPAADIKFGLGGTDGFKFTGNASNTVASETYNGSTTTAMVLHKAVPTVTVSTSGNRMGAASTLTNGASDLFAFKVAADAGGNNVLLYRASFEVATGGSNAVSVTNCYLKDSDGNTIGAAATPTANTGDSAINFLTYTFDNPDFSVGDVKEAIEVAAGSSETFTLNCTVGSAGTGDYVSVALLGDTASSTPAASHGTPASSNANNADSWAYLDKGSFVWSDNYKNRGLSADGANATAWGQWYNGYYVSGLGTQATTTAYTVGWSS